MNKFIGMGRLTKDPVVKYSQGENTIAIARFNVAIDRRRRSDHPNDPTADFISCISFGKNAEFAEKYLHRGVKIVFEGHIQTGSYTNKDGQKVYTTDVVIDSQEFAESKAVNAQAGEESGNDDGFMNIPPEGSEPEPLPFN